MNPLLVEDGKRTKEQENNGLKFKTPEEICKEKHLIRNGVLQCLKNGSKMTIELQNRLEYMKNNYSWEYMPKKYNGIDMEISKKQPMIKLTEFLTKIEENDKIAQDQEKQEKEKLKNNIIEETGKLINEKEKSINKKIDLLAADVSEVKNNNIRIKEDVEKLIEVRNKEIEKTIIRVGEEYKRYVCEKLEQNRIELNEVIESVNKYINDNNKTDRKLKEKIEEVSEILSSNTNRLIENIEELESIDGLLNEHIEEDGEIRETMNIILEWFNNLTMTKFRSVVNDELTKRMKMDKTVDNTVESVNSSIKELKRVNNTR